MKLLFKQRIFSWLDSYDVYDENGDIAYRVEGVLSFGHCLRIYDRNQQLCGEIQEKLFSFLPKYYLYENGLEIGMIEKQLTFFSDSFSVDCNGWDVEGDLFHWDYTIHSGTELIAQISKQLLHFSDTYEIEIVKEADALRVLMVVLAIDIAHCAHRS